MADVTTSGGSAASDGPTGAFGMARELLDHAATEATRCREEADRYARQRELEADLLVQKARRLLEAAEEKAAVIVAMARAESGAAGAGDRVIDLDALAVAPQPPADGIPAGLNDLLASAISHAVSHAFAQDDGA
jgi:hypothetical protein